MINRDMIKASLLTYTDDLDEYGQPRKGTPSEEYIEVTDPILYTHTAVESVLFQDVTHTCLTDNKEVSDKNELKVRDTIYFIKFVNKEGRVAQLFLVRK